MLNAYIKKPFVFIILATIAVFAFEQGALAQIYQTKAKQAFLIDWASGSVLFSKKEDEPMPPASLAKLMTIEVVFNALKNNELSLDDEFMISETAWREGGANSGGSTMFAKLNSMVPLDALLHGIIVQSGNDACIAVAEGMAGNEATFAQLMNRRAKEIGLTGSNFANSTGLPADGQYVTPRDLSVLARHIIDEYPEYYHYFAIPEYTWNGITQQNRNPILGFTQGADGLKTGHTQAAGYGVVASAMRGDQRLIAVLSGMKSKKERREEARKIVNWGFRAFTSQRIYDVDEEIEFASVHGGDQSKVMLVSERPISLFMARSNQGALKARIYYQGPLKAPIEEGTEVATLKIWSDDKLILESPLVTGHAVHKGTITQRALDGLQQLLLGWL
ncbi:D-alanyl-D-alanine carboxypeptidase family protein [Cohaesibacter celericrescens]|uniref:serine-type D-Ala-D-Ala carboxypeptidase n=1 Tax=Cohaesibacter celericrescens TaxID=2067669 RepID=A0A2N5XSY1_9HYPH|nr:D-alanyl-D-alanine carboxypeptidase family protein [Cohaesibacter celericrescens]PLW77613.1 D-alanyl-D-alanine carboxypeptidase [Cohaesibacter celericrescens]